MDSTLLWITWDVGTLIQVEFNRLLNETQRVLLVDCNNHLASWQKGEIFLTLLLMSAIAAQTKWGQSRFEVAYNLQTFKIYFFILQQFTDWISIEWLIQFKYSGKATKFVKKNPTSFFNHLVQLNILGNFFKLFWPSHDNWTLHNNSGLTL